MGYLERASFVAEYLKPMIMAADKNVIGVTYTAERGEEVIIVEWKDTKRLKSCVTGATKMQMAQSIMEAMKLV